MYFADSHIPYVCRVFLNEYVYSIYRTMTRKRTLIQSDKSILTDTEQLQLQQKAEEAHPSPVPATIRNRRRMMIDKADGYQEN